MSFSSGDAGNDLFFAATDVLETAEVAGVLMELELVATTSASNIEVKRAYQLTNDGITFDSPVAFTGDGSFVSALGFSYPTIQETIPVSKRGVRLGFTTNQKAGSDIEQVRVNVTTTTVPR